MRLLNRVLTPRANKHNIGQQLLAPGQPVPETALEDAFISETTAGPRRVTSRRLGKLMLSMLTPQRRRAAAAAAGDDSSCESGVSQAHRPTMAGMLEQQLLLGQPDIPNSRAAPVLTTAPPSWCGDDADADSGADPASEADSETSSLDGFADYVRQLPTPATTMEEPEEWEGSSAADSPTVSSTTTTLSASLVLASATPGTPRGTAQQPQQAEQDLQLLLKAGELPGSRARIADMLLHADSQGPEALAELSLAGLGFERCTALLCQLLLPLPLDSPVATLVQLQAKLATQLLNSLGTSLERALESEKACRRFCRLPYEVASWLLEHAPCDRGETLFDLANLWLERQPGQQPTEEQQRALAALVWRYPLAADFLRCMEANMEWAHHVASSPKRAPQLLPSLDGCFSFTAEFDLHDLLELQQEAMAEGRPRQQQSPAVYCGGYCWWAVLAANPQHDRFELYASCTPFSLFQEPFRAALQPAADVKFTFQGNTALVDCRQSNRQRLAAMHTHWGGAAFRVPAGSTCLAAAPSAARSSPVSQAQATSMVTPKLRLGGAAKRLAAAARPDSARGPRPSNGRPPSRLSIASSASDGVLAATAAAACSKAEECISSSSAPATDAPASLHGDSSDEQADEENVPPTSNTGAKAGRPAAQPQGAAAGSGPLVALSMDQLVAEVRRSCPFSWGASLRVRVHLKMLGS